MSLWDGAHVEKTKEFDFARQSSEIKQPNECRHIFGYYETHDGCILEDDGTEVDIDGSSFNFCPLCGKSLV